MSSPSRSAGSTPRAVSFRLLSQIDSGRFGVCVSVPLVIEYEAVLFRQARSLGLSRRDMDFGSGLSIRVVTPREFLQAIEVIP